MEKNFNIMSDILEKIEALRTESNTVTLRMLIWAAIFGLILAFCLVYYRRRVVGSLVRAIRNANADSPETAKTLAELNQEDNVNAIATLERSASLRRLISIVGTDETETGTILIDERKRLYIAPEDETRARIQYGEKEDSIWPILLGSLALIALGILSLFLL